MLSDSNPKRWFTRPGDKGCYGIALTRASPSSRWWSQCYCLVWDNETTLLRWLVVLIKVSIPRFSYFCSYYKVSNNNTNNNNYYLKKKSLSHFLLPAIHYSSGCVVVESVWMFCHSRRVLVPINQCSNKCLLLDGPQNKPSVCYIPTLSQFFFFFLYTSTTHLRGCFLIAYKNTN